MVSRKRVKNLEKRKKQLRKRKRQQGHFESFEYTITYELTEEDKQFKQLPEQVYQRINELRDSVFTHPEQTIVEFSELIRDYPNIPEFYKYLIIAYSGLGDIKNEEATILACYEKFPDYLIGRLSYAEMCLERGEIEKIPEIFENKLDLKLLYPQRTEFHIAEYTNFTGLVVLYYLLIGKVENSKLLYDVLKQIAPEHPYVEKIESIVSSLASAVDDFKYFP
ncbi:MAG: hypothetical protein SVR94_02910 [Pseudomonadota bacterium]|nr:hypothetical protein [Pseudomonadota bacterium]